jgi:hypothetical protein
MAAPVVSSLRPAGGGPAFTLGGKLEPPKTSASEAPDPGAYGIPDTGAGKGPAFSLGGKRKELDPALHLQVRGRVSAQ